MPRAPRFSANAAVSYSQDFAGGKIDLAANGYYSSKFFFDSPNRFVNDGYGLLNLRATWTTADDSVAFSVYGTNVTDSRYRNQVLPGSFGISQSFGEPASYGASITFRM